MAPIAYRPLASTVIALVATAVAVGGQGLTGADRAEATPPAPRHGDSAWSGDRAVAPRAEARSDGVGDAVREAAAQPARVPTRYAAPRHHLRRTFHHCAPGSARHTSSHRHAGTRHHCRTGLRCAALHAKNHRHHAHAATGDTGRTPQRYVSPRHEATPPAVAGDPRSTARSLLSAYGFGSDQFGCLDRLWAKESGWNPAARNRSSGAYGIPQSLPAGKLASAGSDWRTNPRTQIQWGLSYIASRYGTPCEAWNHSRRANWY